MQNRALVVIDIQNDSTKDYKNIIDRVNKAIDFSVENNLHVIYFKHNNLEADAKMFRVGTVGAEFVPELKIVTDNIFIKTEDNALSNKDFSDYIASNAISDFILVGADAAFCVKATSENMCKANYNVTVLSDCITSYYKSKIDEFLKYYESVGCKLETLEDFIS